MENSAFVVVSCEVKRYISGLFRTPSSHSFLCMKKEDLVVRRVKGDSGRTSYTVCPIKNRRCFICRITSQSFVSQLEG